MINEKAVVEEHDTDEGFYKQMPEVQHTLRKNVYFFFLEDVGIMLYSYDMLGFLLVGCFFCFFSC